MLRRHLLVLATIVMSIFVTFDSHAQKSSGSSSRGRGTGSGGGGGDFDHEAPVTDEMIVSRLSNVYGFLPFVLNHFEAQARGQYENLPLGLEPHSPDQEAMSRLFPADPRRKNVFQRLRELKFVATNDPCLNEYGQPVAASAYPYMSDEVCFNIPLIRAGASSANLGERLLALAFHEVMHKMLIEDETAPRDFESVLKRTLPSKPYYYLMEQLDRLFTNNLSVTAQAKSLIGKAEAGHNMASLCYSLSRFISVAYDLDRNFRNSGVPIAALRSADLQLVDSIHQQTTGLGEYCANNPSKEGRENLVEDLKKIQSESEALNLKIEAIDPVFHGIIMSRRLIKAY